MVLSACSDHVLLWGGGTSRGDGPSDRRSSRRGFRGEIRGCLVGSCPGWSPERRQYDSATSYRGSTAVVPWAVFIAVPFRRRLARIVTGVGGYAAVLDYVVRCCTEREAETACVAMTTRARPRTTPRWGSHGVPTFA